MSAQVLSDNDLLGQVPLTPFIGVECHYCLNLWSFSLSFFASKPLAVVELTIVQAAHYKYYLMAVHSRTKFELSSKYLCSVAVSFLAFYPMMCQTKRRDSFGNNVFLSGFICFYQHSHYCATYGTCSFWSYPLALLRVFSFNCGIPSRRRHRKNCRTETDDLCHKNVLLHSWVSHSRGQYLPGIAQPLFKRRATFL